MRIVSIDVGVFNMGVIYVDINENWTINSIIDCFTEDITFCCDNKCKLSHTNFTRVSERVRHFLLKYSKYFDEADIILCEQQPPHGLQSIESVITYAYPQTILISPRSMHAYFDIGYLDYDNRKKAVERIAVKYLQNFDSWENYKRKHDMADAFCIMKYHISIQKKLFEEKEIHEEWKLNHNKVISEWQTFKYTEDN